MTNPTDLSAVIEDCAERLANSLRHQPNAISLIEQAKLVVKDGMREGRLVSFRCLNSTVNATHSCAGGLMLREGVHGFYGLGLVNDRSPQNSTGTITDDSAIQAALDLAKEKLDAL